MTKQRNALVSLSLSLPCLIFHHREQKILALLFFALGIFANEMTLGMGCYLFAHVVYLERKGPLWSRLIKQLGMYATSFVRTPG
jgi:hypothetical protein